MRLLFCRYLKNAILCWTALLALCGTAPALELAGVTVPETASIETGSEPLVLNGAGVRRVFLANVYIGALYLPARLHDAGSILDVPGTKRLVLRFLHSVSAERIMEAFMRGLAANHSAEELEGLKDRFHLLNDMFRTVQEGDELRLDYIPGVGTMVWLNEELLRTIRGEDFYRALLRVWLGREVADTGLKQALLGSS